MDAARQNRYGHCDPAAYRHGLRAIKLVSLCWDDIDLTSGRLHVRRANQQ
jgi:integrase